MTSSRLPWAFPLADFHGEDQGGNLGSHSLASHLLLSHLPRSLNRRQHPWSRSNNRQVRPNSIPARTRVHPLLPSRTGIEHIVGQMRRTAVLTHTHRFACPVDQLSPTIHRLSDVNNELHTTNAIFRAPSTWPLFAQSSARVRKDFPAPGAPATSMLGGHFDVLNCCVEHPGRITDGPEKQYTQPSRLNAREYSVEHYNDWIFKGIGRRTQ